jgi:hypothetical protein
MVTRRWFLGTTAFLALAGNRLAFGDQASRSLLDLNFLDRNASDNHKGTLVGRLRYVDHEVFGDPAGIAIEEAAFNGVEDAGYSAATALPSGWHAAPGADRVIAFTRLDGGAGRLQLQGKDADEFYVAMGSDRHFEVKRGDRLTGSVALRLFSGELGGLKKIELCVIQRNSDGTTQPPIVAPIQLIQTDKPWWAEVRTVAQVDGFATLALRVTTQAKFDLTFELKSPQLEKRGWRSTFCATAREDDHIVLADSMGYLSRPERSVLITADAPRFVAASSLWCEFGDQNNYVEIQQRERTLYATVMSDGVLNEVRLGTVPPLMRFSVCLIQWTGGFAASLNGKELQTVECSMPQNLKTARLGSGSSGNWNSTLARLTLFAERRLDGAALSRQGQFFFDDFDRPNSSQLGTSPTGQSIRWSGTVGSAIADRKWIALSGGLGLAFAAYGTVRLPQVPRYLGAVLNWTTGTSGAGAGLIAATADLDPSKSVDALHTIVSDQKEIFQTITGSRVDPPLAAFVYPVPMRRDNQTVYGVACMINARENAVVYVGPEGDLARHVDAAYTRCIGPVAVFEHYWQFSQCRPEFWAVAAAWDSTDQSSFGRRSGSK